MFNKEVVEKKVYIEKDLLERFNELCEKNDNVSNRECFNQLLKAGFLYLEQQENILEENEDYTYEDKLIKTRKNIEKNIKSFNETFLDSEYIINDILELVKSYDSFSNNQHTRCKDILKKSIYVLFKFKKNDFTVKDLNTLITNPGGEGRMIVNNFLKIPSKTEKEQVKNLEIATFFLNDFFDKDFKTKKDEKDNIYTKDVILLSYYLNELIEVNSIEKTIDSSIDDNNI